MKKSTYTDLADLEEDKRIERIGDAVITGKIVAFVVDAEGANGQAKADRYLAKLKKMFPAIRVVKRFDGPVIDTVTVKVSL